MSSGNESDSEMEMEAEVCNVDPCDIVVLEVGVDPEAHQDPDINRDRGEDLDELIVVAADDEENEDEPIDDATSADIEGSSSSSSIDDSSSESSAEDESVEEARRSPRRRNARFESSDRVEDARRPLRHRNSRLENTRSVQDVRRPQRRRNARFGNNDSARNPRRLLERRNAISENTASDYEPMDTTSDNDLRNIQLRELEDEETDRRLLRTLQLHRAEYNERMGNIETTESRDILSSAGVSNVDVTDNAEMMDGNSEMRAGNAETFDNSETVGNSEMTVNSASIVNPAAAIGIENASPYDLESSPEGILLRGTVISRPRRRRRRLTIYKKAGQIAFHSFGYINEEELRLNRAWLNARGYQTRILSAEERHAFLLQLARASAPPQTETSTCNQSTMTRNRRTNVSVQTSRIVRRATRRRASSDRLVLQWEILMPRRRQVPLPRAPPQAPARSSSPPPPQTQRANLPNASQSNSSGTRSLHSVPRIKINNQTFEFSCPICLDSYLQHSPTITQCGHIFCKICLLRHCIFGGNNRYVCPLCLSRLNPNKFHRVYF